MVERFHDGVRFDIAGDGWCALMNGRAVPRCLVYMQNAGSGPHQDSQRVHCVADVMYVHTFIVPISASLVGRMDHARPRAGIRAMIRA